MRLLALVKTTLREMIHDKIFLIVLVISVFIFGFSLILGALSFSEQQKILADFGFLAIELACVVISIFFGSYMISKEIEKQTCLLILSRPITRQQFILSKFLGVTILNVFIIFVLSLLLGLLLNVWSTPGTLFNLFIVSLSIFFKTSVLLALAFAFSQMVRPVLALAFVVVVYLMGHWIEDAKFFAQRTKEDTLIQVIKVIDWTSPNFYRMNWKSYGFLVQSPPSSEILWMVLHSTAWILLLVLLMQHLFRRKDIV